MNLLTGLVFLGVAVFVCQGALALSLGTLRAPEPGLYPFILGVVLGVLGLLLCLSGLRARPPAGGEGRRGGSPHRRAVAATVITLLAYSALLPAVGYGPATVIGLGALFRLGGVGWRSAVLLSLVFTAGTMAGAALLGIALPDGALLRRS